MAGQCSLWTSVSGMEASATGESVDHGACGGDGDGEAVQEGVRYGERTDCRGTVVDRLVLHRLLQPVWERNRPEERERCEQFERGEPMLSEFLHRTDILYTEADGEWKHPQR